MQKLKRGDIVLILVVLLAAASFYGVKWLKERNEHFTQGELQAVISINGKTYQTVPLTKEEQVIDIKTKYGHNILKVYDYGIEMTYSDAPLPIALDMGFISRPRQQIICIPARLMVEVINPAAPVNDPDALDAVI
ncbi:NusG domain II-containing protein [Paenibacillus tepidiphilus]|uniref:NusG domain II-containing protein n=1 Tax=Paenibacillus tepidiphilus TaxID=2608683 RepID=UPI00123A588D|nr:NusG domain II-containing protein [Paenibacillus tepidiphilus]